MKKVFQPAGYYQPERFELMQLEAEEDPEAHGKLRLRMQTADVTTQAQRDHKLKIVPVSGHAGLTNSTTASADSSTRALQQQYIMSQDPTRN